MEHARQTPTSGPLRKFHLQHQQSTGNGRDDFERISTTRTRKTNTVHWGRCINHQVNHRFPSSPLLHPGRLKIHANSTLTAPSMTPLCFDQKCRSEYSCMKTPTSSFIHSVLATTGKNFYPSGHKKKTGKTSGFRCSTQLLIFSQLLSADRHWNMTAWHSAFV